MKNANECWYEANSSCVNNVNVVAAATPSLWLLLLTLFLLTLCELRLVYIHACDLYEETALERKRNGYVSTFFVNREKKSWIFILMSFQCWFLKLMKNLSIVIPRKRSMQKKIYLVFNVVPKGTFSVTSNGHVKQSMNDTNLDETAFFNVFWNGLNQSHRIPVSNSSDWVKWILPIFCIFTISFCCFFIYFQFYFFFILIFFCLVSNYIYPKRNSIKTGKTKQEKKIH